MNRATERVVDRIRRQVEHQRRMCLMPHGAPIKGMEREHSVLAGVLIDIDAACRPHCSRCQQELPARKASHACKDPAA